MAIGNVACRSVLQMILVSELCHCWIFLAIFVDIYMSNGKADSVKLTESTFSLLNSISLPSF